jgi:hypothetical protein
VECGKGEPEAGGEPSGAADAVFLALANGPARPDENSGSVVPVTSEAAVAAVATLWT